MDGCIAVVLNRAAGSAKDRQARRHLRELLGADVNVYSAAGGAELRKFALKCIEDGCRVVVAAGGDGTINIVASLLVGTGVALGVLPMGTLNHFARDVGIPPDIDAASRVILAGHSTLVDVGKVNDRFFINNSSLGLYPSIVRRREHRERTGTSRLLAFAAAIVFVLRRYPFLHAHIQIDGKEIDRRSPFLFIGNNHYELEGLRLGRRSRIDGGVLSLYTANRTGRFGLLRIAVSALFRRLQLNRDFEALAAHDLTIATRRKRVSVALDGEVVHMTPPLHYTVQPAALRVMVPA